MKSLSAITLSALLASTSVGYAQTTTPAPSMPAPATAGSDAPMTMPMAPTAQKPSVAVTTPSGESYRISAGELAAIGIGVVVGATLVHAAVGHGLMLVGAAVGGWIGDWWYYAPPQHMAAK